MLEVVGLTVARSNSHYLIHILIVAHSHCQHPIHSLVVPAILVLVVCRDLVAVQVLVVPAMRRGHRKVCAIGETIKIDLNELCVIIAGQGAGLEGIGRCWPWSGRSLQVSAVVCKVLAVVWSVGVIRC